MLVAVDVIQPLQLQQVADHQEVRVIQETEQSQQQVPQVWKLLRRVSHDRNHVQGDDSYQKHHSQRGPLV